MLWRTNGYICYFWFQIIRSVKIIMQIILMQNNKL